MRQSYGPIGLLDTSRSQQCPDAAIGSFIGGEHLGICHGLESHRVLELARHLPASVSIQVAGVQRLGTHLAVGAEATSQIDGIALGARRNFGPVAGGQKHGRCAQSSHAPRPVIPYRHATPPLKHESG